MNRIFIFFFMFILVSCNKDINAHLPELPQTVTVDFEGFGNDDFVFYYLYARYPDRNVVTEELNLSSRHKILRNENDEILFLKKWDVLIFNEWDPSIPDDSDFKNYTWNHSDPNLVEEVIMSRESLDSEGLEWKEKYTINASEDQAFRYIGFRSAISNDEKFMGWIKISMNCFDGSFFIVDVVQIMDVDYLEINE